MSAAKKWVAPPGYRLLADIVQEHGRDHVQANLMSGQWPAFKLISNRRSRADPGDNLVRRPAGALGSRGCGAEHGLGLCGRASVRQVATYAVIVRDI